MEAPITVEAFGVKAGLGERIDIELVGRIISREGDVKAGLVTCC